MSTATTVTPSKSAAASQSGAVMIGQAPGHHYYNGTPGNKTWPAGAMCSEAAAVKKGSAVATNTPAKLCEHIQGITIVIGDTYSTLDSAIQQVNMEFSCNGNKPTLSTNFNLRV